MPSALRPRLHIHTSIPTPSSPPIPIPTHLRPLHSNTTLISPQLWTTLHPSTLSIYTHLLPALLLLTLTISISIPTTPYNLPSLPIPARTILLFNLLAATTTLLLSTTYHLHQHTPPPTAEKFLRYDYSGIIFLLVANYTTGLYFGFYTQWELTWRYALLILILTLFPLTTHLVPKSQSQSQCSHHATTLRITSLVLPALTALIPILHAYRLYGKTYLWDVGVGWYLLEGVMFLLGMGVYLLILGLGHGDEDS
ncbi:hypothetical protein BO78DRAFT_389757 [Aspergillus sclerotiicarbonarius CBS 121057]|uniref:Uncharacterized protein n=1 Tax=Aspergillus sclerotiicarbonarius (strain CBS 121057 / IBT 28362) TaxID=1448318 RepID=A0A319DYV1_ASPSB|nr:hypothetical protein BO78DRAFT_389757 [Aspergillus sclerotiicarbonarius CBS 121057]